MDPYSRLLFAGLWVLADREGRLEDRPAKIKAQIFPYNDVDIEGLILTLACGFITRYSVNGKKYIVVNEFTAHQHVHHEEKVSVLPSPKKAEKITITNAGETPRQSGETPRQSGETPKQSVYKPVSCILNPVACISNPDNVLAPSPSDSKPPVLVFNAVGKKEWHLTAEKVTEWSESYPGVDILAECKKARQWAIDNPSKNKTAKGHPAFLSRWLSKAQDSGKSNRPSQHIPIPTDSPKIRAAKGDPKLPPDEHHDWSRTSFSERDVLMAKYRDIRDANASRIRVAAQMAERAKQEAEMVEDFNDR